ncbi:MAG: UDP-N-acetylmuramate dehydrogenase [Pseudomonadales bacterium]
MPCQIQRYVNLQSANTLRLPAIAEYFVDVTDASALPEALQFARDKELPMIVLGEGSNLVLGPKLPGLVIRMSSKGIARQGDRLTIAAGENWHGLVMRSLDMGLYGLENLALIPGTAGAAPMQNIGAYGAELADVFHELTALNRQTLETVRFSRADCGFGYRSSLFKTNGPQRFKTNEQQRFKTNGPQRFKASEQQRWVIVDITLALSSKPSPSIGYQGLAEKLEQLGLAPEPKSVAQAVMALRREKLPDPATEPNAGSFFKNPCLTQTSVRRLREKFSDLPVYQAGGETRVSAAWLIEEAGLKGHQVGDAVMSARHALVLVNSGRATVTEVVGLASYVRSVVHEKFGMWLELEPQAYHLFADAPNY